MLSALQKLSGQASPNYSYLTAGGIEQVKRNCVLLSKGALSQNIFTTLENLGQQISEFQNVYNLYNRIISARSAENLQECNAHLIVLSILENGIKKGSPYYSVIVTLPPPLRNPLFTGRIEVLKEMEETLNASTSLLKLIAIVGDEGVGKSSLILEYLFRNSQNSPVYWIDGDNLLTEYRMLAESLGAAGAYDNIITVKINLKNWLEENPGWLLVIDNATSMETITPLLPEKGGTVFVTSRNQKWAQPIVLERLSQEDSIKFLIKLTGRKEDSDFCKIAEALKGIPLALSLAGTYMVMQDMSSLEYLREYQKKGQLFTENQEIVTPLRLSLEVIQKKSPESIWILHLLSLLGAEEIPECLLPKKGETDQTFEKKLKPLLDFGLVNRGNEKGKLSIQRSAQSMIQQTLSSDQRANALRTLYEQVELIWTYHPENKTTWPVTLSLLRHLGTLILSTPNEDPFFESKTKYLIVVTNFLIANLTAHLRMTKRAKLDFSSDECVDFFNETLAISKDICKTDLPRIIKCLFDIATALRDRGEIKDATLLLFQAIEIAVGIFGTDNLATAHILESRRSIFYRLYLESRRSIFANSDDDLD